MKTIFLGIFSSLASLSFSQSAEPVQSLVNAEKTFANMAKEKSTKQAFSTFLSDSCLIFQPGPILGKKFWQQADESEDLLSWKPVYAFATSSGDMGYSTGPWEYYPKRTDTAAVANGYFVSIWKKENDTWKVILDIGISFPMTDKKEAERFENAAITHVKKKTTTGIKEELLNTEAAFINEQAKTGYNAYSRFVNSNPRFYRPGHFPFITDESRTKLFAETDKRFRYEMMDGAVSATGDLGYVYGKATIEAINDDSARKINGNYLRIWKKENNEWKIVLDLVNINR